MHQLFSARWKTTGFLAALEDLTDDGGGFGLGRHSLQVIPPGAFGLKEGVPTPGFAYTETGPGKQ